MEQQGRRASSAEMRNHFAFAAEGSGGVHVVLRRALRHVELGAQPPPEQTMVEIVLNRGKVTPRFKDRGDLLGVALTNPRRSGPRLVPRAGWDVAVIEPFPNPCHSHR